MACRGMHYAITVDEANQLRGIADEQEQTGAGWSMQVQASIGPGPRGQIRLIADKTIGAG